MIHKLGLTCLVLGVLAFFFPGDPSENPWLKRGDSFAPTIQAANVPVYVEKTNATTLTLKRKQGLYLRNLLTAHLLEVDTEVTKDTTGLSSSTTYYIYCDDNAAIATSLANPLELSTTSPSTTYGIKHKPLDTSKLYLGSVATNGSTEFGDVTNEYNSPMVAGGAATQLDDGTTVFDIGTLTIGQFLKVNSGGTALTTSYPLTPTATKTGNYTAVEGDLVIADASSASFTITLPASPDNGALVGAHLDATASNRTVTLAPGMGDTIESHGDHILYIEDDYFEVVYNDTTDTWSYRAKDVQPHVCRIYRGTAQTLTTATNTKIQFGTVEYDQGGLADLTNFRVTIRRPGLYKVAGGFNLSVDPGKGATGTLNINDTTNIRNFTSYNPTAGSDTAFAHPPQTDYICVAGDDFYLYAEHNHGSDRNTLTSAPGRPYLSVTEIK